MPRSKSPSMMDLDFRYRISFGLEFDRRSRPQITDENDNDDDEIKILEVIEKVPKQPNLDHPNGESKPSTTISSAETRCALVPNDLIDNQNGAHSHSEGTRKTRAVNEDTEVMEIMSTAFIQQSIETLHCVDSSKGPLEVETPPDIDSRRRSTQDDDEVFFIREGPPQSISKLQSSKSTSVPGNGPTIQLTSQSTWSVLMADDSVSEPVVDFINEPSLAQNNRKRNYSGLQEVKSINAEKYKKPRNEIGSSQTSISSNANEDKEAAKRIVVEKEVVSSKVTKDSTDTVSYGEKQFSSSSNTNSNGSGKTRWDSVSGMNKEKESDDHSHKYLLNSQQNEKHQDHKKNVHGSSSFPYRHSHSLKNESTHNAYKRGGNARHFSNRRPGGWDYHRHRSNDQHYAKFRDGGYNHDKHHHHRQDRLASAMSENENSAEASSNENSSLKRRERAVDSKYVKETGRSPRINHNGNDEVTAHLRSGQENDWKTLDKGSSSKLESVVAHKRLTVKDVVRLIKTCPICKLVSETRDKGTLHLKKEHEMKFCFVCFKPFSTKGFKLKQHFLEKHTHNDRQEKAACPLCKEKFTMDGIYHHIAKRHLVPDKLNSSQKQKCSGIDQAAVSQRNDDRQRHVTVRHHRQNEERVHHHHTSSKINREYDTMHQSRNHISGQRNSYDRKVGETGFSVSADEPSNQSLLQERENDVEHNLVHASRSSIIAFKIPKKVKETSKQTTKIL